MCLFNQKKSVEKFLANNKGKVTITVYKRLRNKDYNGNASKNLISPHRETPWFAGWNVSDSQAKGPRLKTCDIRKGMHVYLNRKLAKAWLSDDEVVVSLTVWIQDLIGVDGNGRAVFKKAYLSKRNYNKAIGN